MSSWRSRGRRRGLCEFNANQAAAKTKEQKADFADATRKVEAALRTTVGSDAHVMKAGSQFKHTDIASSDRDVLLKTKNPLTSKQKAEFERNAELQGLKVDPWARTTTITTAGGQEMDAVPSGKPEYYEANSRSNKDPTDRTQNGQNKKLEQAIRTVKATAEAEGKHWSGNKIELATIAEQQKNPQKTNQELADAVMKMPGLEK